MMNKEEKYTKKDFIVIFVVAVIISLFYFATYGISCLSGTISMPDSIKIVSLLWSIGSPLILIMVWYMCVERYLYLKIPAEELRDVRKYWGTYLEIAVTVILGIVTFFRGLRLVSFSAEHWVYIETLRQGVVLKIVIILGWLLCTIYSTKIGKMLKEGKKGKVVTGVVILLLLLVCTKECDTYVNNQAGDAWYQNLVESQTQ